MSRTKAKEALSLEEYKETMKGIYTTMPTIDNLIVLAAPLLFFET